MGRRKRIHGHRRRKCSPIRQDSIWSKGTTSIAPKQPDTSAFAPEEGSTADLIVDKIVPKTGMEALGMIGGAGVVRKSAKLFKVMKGAFKHYSAK
tara:strand:+ start:363 stop:647 length:285 start_codon:yes stop_codon:yes gene_type:complete